MSERHLSEQEIIRRQKLQQLQELNINPYPPESFEINVTAKDIKENYERDKLNYKNISIAGRILSIRDMGKAAFAVIQDATEKIQLYIKRDEICPGEDKTLYDVVWKKLIDIGDIIGVNGYVFTTKTGEISIHVLTFKLLAKALKPLPVVKVDESGKVHDAVTDPEFRYRQRYVDLIINPHVKNIFIKRTKIIQSIREYFNNKGYLEVETPVLQPIPGGAAARPFITHHNALDIPLYLRIANELYLKRLIVGGFEGVYEFAKNFRNEGIDRTHNPEFTGLEIYVAYKDYLWMMEFTEQMIEKVVTDLYDTTDLEVEGKIINFKAPFKRMTIVDAIKEKINIDISLCSEHELRELCKKHHVEVDETMGKGKLIDELFSALCEKELIQPTFIMDYPIETSPLTKKHRNKPGFVERFELYINGQEIANAYTELNDPIDQYHRFEEQVKLKQKGDDEAMYMDYDFIRALEYGMPPTAGLGVGIDRLTMLLTNQHSIQEVIFFPQMRPEKISEPETETTS
ncbi:MAG: lysine--tRNA ligase [Bacteroidia bacterium]|nr:lysine--tRNA ligase [Bacteroidia bacterium]